MKDNWVSNCIISGFLSFCISYYYSKSIGLSLVSFIVAFILVLWLNPVTRYMKAFYIIIFPLFNKTVFDFRFKGEDYDFYAGLKELDWVSILVLGLIAIFCLILDFLERNKESGVFFIWKKNSIGDVNGDNNKINQ